MAPVGSWLVNLTETKILSDSLRLNPNSHTHLTPGPASALTLAIVELLARRKLGFPRLHVENTDYWPGSGLGDRSAFVPQRSEIGRAHV